MKPIIQPEWPHRPACIVQGETRAQRRATILLAEKRRAATHGYYPAGDLIEDADGRPLAAAGKLGISVDSVMEDELAEVGLRAADVPHLVVLPTPANPIPRRWPEDMPGSGGTIPDTSHGQWL